MVVREFNFAHNVLPHYWLNCLSKEKKIENFSEMYILFEKKNIACSKKHAKGGKLKN